MTIHKPKRAEHNNAWELELGDCNYLTYIFLPASVFSVVISNKTHTQKKHQTPPEAHRDLNGETDEQEKAAQRTFPNQQPVPVHWRREEVQPSLVENEEGTEGLMLHGKNHPEKCLLLIPRDNCDQTPYPGSS